MAVPSNVVRVAFAEAFKHNSKIIANSGQLADTNSPFQAIVVFETRDGNTVAVKWSSSRGYQYIG